MKFIPPDNCDCSDADGVCSACWEKINTLEDAVTLLKVRRKQLEAENQRLKEEIASLRVSLRQFDLKEEANKQEER